MNKIIIETTLKELEKHGLVVCKCGHPPNNHFLQFGDNDKSCAHCDCKNYSPKILLGKKAGQVEPEVIVKTAEEIKEKYPCLLGCSVEMEDGLSYEQVLQANAYRLEGAMWATGNKSSFPE